MKTYTNLHKRELYRMTFAIHQTKIWVIVLYLAPHNYTFVRGLHRMFIHLVGDKMELYGVGSVCLENGMQPGRSYCYPIIIIQRFFYLVEI